MDKNEDKYLMINYHEILEQITRRMLFIKTSSLECALLNDEWNALFRVQNELFKLIKIQEKLNG